MDEIIKEKLSKVKTAAEVYVLFGYTRNPNARSRNKVKERLKEYGIEDLTSFLKSKRPEIEKIECPVCFRLFLPSFTSRGGQRVKQVTCSRSCSNTMFRSGENHWNYSTGESAYRNIAINHYGHKCIVCEETTIVEVHHLDHNRLNNSITNLIVLCPTHHRYMHLGHKQLVLDRMNAYNLGK